MSDLKRGGAPARPKSKRIVKPKKLTGTEQDSGLEESAVAKSENAEPVRGSAIDDSTGFYLDEDGDLDPDIEMISELVSGQPLPLDVTSISSRAADEGASENPIRDTRRTEKYEVAPTSVESRPAANPPAPPAPKVSYKSSDFYLTQVYFDRGQNKFIGYTLEFPEIRSQGITKEQAYAELERKLEGHLAGLRNRGETIPEAFYAKSYPPLMQLPISQNLFRRLDLLSRQEKQSVEVLVVELLTQALERRYQPGGRMSSGQPQRSDRQPSSGGDRDRDRSSGNRHSGQQNQGNNNRRGQQQSRRPQGRGGYHESLDNKENFLEYVRNLEKSGGGAGNWRKK